MKKAFALAAAFALAFSLAGGGGASSAGSGAASASASQAETGGEPVELTVFAAASLTETLNQIAEDYKTVAPNVTLTFNFDSSGTLKTQIQEGAVCDVFLSAGQKQMDQLDKTADASVNTEGLDFVAEGTRVNLLENKVALCVAEGSDAAIASFDDLAGALEGSDILMAMGNSDVPAGQYTQQILACYGLNEEELANAGKITYGSNVKEVATQITEGSVDCGVVYCTDAYSAGITPVDYATEEMCGQVIYPAAVLNVSQHSEEAQAFLDYLQTDAAMQVFEEVGFSPVI
ncbi:molybdate ABC transporter substrate-binding protein [Allofournierella massiliensis]|uniref:molybdate ABC transporter substrate-binding protein n=1 Tax=Allofournierella massiliensis TaxID=1650663 RepID=UPI00399F1EE4